MGEVRSESRPLHILHCAYFNEDTFGRRYYFNGHRLSNGLIRAGHSVYNFSARDVARQSTVFRSRKFGAAKMNRRLLEVVENYRPDLLLMGHTEMVRPETLARVRAIAPDIKIAMYWLDWVRNLRNIQAYFPHLDRFFISSDPAELDTVLYDPSPRPPAHFLANFADAAIDRKRGFDRCDYRYDVLFVGRPDSARSEMIECLEAIDGLRVGHFGYDKKNMLFGEQYLETIATSRIAINYSRTNTYFYYSSDRLIHLVANGAMVLCQRYPGAVEIFSEDEMVYFSNLTELQSLARHYIANDDQRRQIAKAGWRRAHRDYDSAVIGQRMVKAIFDE